MTDLNSQGSCHPEYNWQAGVGALLDWYDMSRRVLPWRALPGEKSDAYAVWLSEIMLQQTTVAAVKPYYINFLKRWPSVIQLAQAPVEDIMRQWAGLGYYSRARNLHTCAKMVADQHAGVFPSHEADLLRLPGIGPYTAAAIAAIAFGRRAVVVDGNVERVIARLFAIPAPLPAGKAMIRKKAEFLTPAERPGDYAQAMMDLGATICTPRRPSCAICPFLGLCMAQASSQPEDFPKKAQKAERSSRKGAVFYICRHDGAVLVRNRPPKGLLGGMAEFPGTDWTPDLEATAALAEAPIKGSYKLLEGKIEHVFTHFALQLNVYFCMISNTTKPPEGCRFIARADLETEAFPSVMRKIIKLVDRRLSLSAGEKISQARLDLSLQGADYAEAPG